jgi:pseudouridine-5'-phosphate glycosidase
MHCLCSESKGREQKQNKTLWAAMPQSQRCRVAVLANHLCSQSRGNREVFGDGKDGKAPGSSREEVGLPKRTVVCSPEVNRALETQLRGKRKHNNIVALESTIVSHGMPYPENYRTAKEVEDIVRATGSVPATICVLGGIIRVGLTDDELRYISRNKGDSVKKLSRRDLARAMALGLDGATTVASTMMIASMVGIRVFVTGGIGGVHRSYSDSMDVSADLVELGRTPVAVVCAGVKSILDVPRTLEFLETQGVSVCAYGTNEFPCFYYNESGLEVSRIDGCRQCARLIDGNLDIDGKTGLVIAVPDDNEERGKEYTKVTGEIKKSIETALEEARAKGATGSSETPYVLRRVAELTGGASLRRNIALIKRNAEVGGDIAKVLSELN